MGDYREKECVGFYLSAANECPRFCSLELCEAFDSVEPRAKFHLETTERNHTPGITRLATDDLFGTVSVQPFI